MATRTASFDNSTVQAMVVTWSGLLNGDDGSSVELPDWADRCVQVTGTFGTGGNMRFQGSIDGTNWAPLTDPQGNAMNLTAAGIEQVTEITRYVRPLITAGDGTTTLVVSMYARRNR
jgi:hypothetical protein